MASNPNPFDQAGNILQQKAAEAEAKRASATSDAQAALAADKSEHYATTRESTKAKMKAEADGKEFGYSNPKFDPRIMSWKTSGIASGGGALQRGYMEQSSTYWKDTGQKKPYRCNFLYNPSTFSVGYQTNLGVLPSTAQTDGQLQATALISSMQEVSFSLLFDRTYEVANLGDVSKKDRKLLEQGVYADIASLERCVGIYRTTGSMLGGQGGIQRIPMNLVFGTLGAAAKPLGWFGFVATMNVDYTHFGYNMTPTRATAGIVFSQLAKLGGKVVDPQDSGGVPASDATAVS